MKKTLSFIFVIILFSQLCNAQASGAKSDIAAKNEFYDTEFKWRILVPPGFDTVSSVAYAEVQKIGVDEITYNKTKITTSRICAYTNHDFDYFDAQKQTFDPKTDGSFFLHCKTNDNNTYKRYRGLLGTDLLIDTSVSNEIIDGLTFRKFKLQITFTDKGTMDIYEYSRLFDTEVFTFGVSYMNEAKGDLILDAWRNSKFEKN